MPTTYVNISTQTLGSTVASVTFSAIPQTYTDLELRMSLRSSTGGTAFSSLQPTFNGATSTYSANYFEGNNATAFAGSFNNQSFFRTDANYAGISTVANDFSIHEIYIPNYTLTTNKTIMWFDAVNDNNTTQKVLGTAGIFIDTNALTSITLTGQFNFVAGSTFYLYGIKNS
jgi:hypothetical protein